MKCVKKSLESLGPAHNLALNEKVLGMKEMGMDILHLAFGQSPFPVPDFAQKALAEHVDKASYLAVKGLKETRNTICEHHARLDGLLHFSPDDVIIGPGSKELIYSLMSVVSGDIYLLSPTWTTYYPQSVLNGKRSHIIKTSEKNGWKLTPDLLEPYAKEAIPGSVLVLCNPDNPTGACYTRVELEALADVIRCSNLLVVSDEIYARLTFSGSHSSISEFVPAKTILSSGISKWASCGGWRFGYHLYPKELRAVLRAVVSVASNSYSCASAPVQYAANTILRFGSEAQGYSEHCSRILAKVAEYGVKKLIKAGVKVTAPGAGYYMFPDFSPFAPRFHARNIKTGNEMCAAILEEAKVALLAGGPAFLRESTCFTVRLCFINFDGGTCLKKSQEIGLQNDLPENFVEVYCKETVQALERIVKWLDSLPETKTD